MTERFESGEFRGGKKERLVKDNVLLFLAILTAMTLVKCHDIVQAEPSRQIAETKGWTLLKMHQAVDGVSGRVSALLNHVNHLGNIETIEEPLGDPIKMFSSRSEDGTEELTVYYSTATSLVQRRYRNGELVMQRSLPMTIHEHMLP